MLNLIKLYFLLDNLLIIKYIGYLDDKKVVAIPKIEHNLNLQIEQISF